MERVGSTICRLPGQKGLVQFTKPIATVETKLLSEVIEKFHQVESFTNQGYYAVGYISYEAAPAFDAALECLQPNAALPLLLFYIYDQEPTPFENNKYAHREHIGIAPELSKADYTATIKQVLDYIYQGDIYQANYTFRAQLPEIKDPFNLFKALIASNPVPYAGFLSHESHSIVSISPELFIEKQQQNIISKPMKGTTHRHPVVDEDEKQFSFLANDPKNRAENLMIVDMVRNDFGRLATTGSVKVDPLFQVESYATVHQMTSTVWAETQLSVVDIFKDTFPAASITGAPKVRATEIIKELEQSPRGIYCGAFGVITPSGDFCFNVPIRTITCYNNRPAELGIGSGIVADSVPTDEWQESLLKSQFVNNQSIEFDLFETLSWQPSFGYSDLEAHLDRLKKSQQWYKRSVPNDIEAQLPAEFDSPQRIKIILSKTGIVKIENSPTENFSWPENPRIKISNHQTKSTDHFLYHKTTRRQVYNQAFQTAKSEGFTEVIFFNEKEELTEGSISNIFIKEQGKWFTPALVCGLLPGVERAKLIQKLNATPAIITKDRLIDAEQIIICNSLRGSTAVKLIF